MRHAGRIGLVLAVVLTACAPPASGSPTGARLPSGSIGLSGTIAGLLPGASADVRLELLAPGQKVGQGQVLTRFGVTNGQWEQTGLALEPGRYGLVAESEGYVSRFGTTTFEMIPGAGAWIFRHLDFELMRPENAVARVGVPLCATPPPNGGVYAVPEGPPTATPTFTPRTITVTASALDWPPGTCYAGQYNSMEDLTAGIYGVVNGLPPKQSANILIYLLPPVPGENYSISTAPLLDGSWHYPEGLTQMATAPTLGHGEVLTLTLAVSNGQWGVIDNGLIGRKYLVMGQAAGRTAHPPAYQVVIFGGKIIMPAGKVNFDFDSK